MFNPKTLRISCTTKPNRNQSLISPFLFLGDETSHTFFFFCLDRLNEERNGVPLCKPLPECHPSSIYFKLVLVGKYKPFSPKLGCLEL